MTQPLAGLKVLDLTTLLPGPMATLMLAAAGAEVLKVERPGGDDMRRYPPLWHGVGAAFQILNPGRRSVTLDLKTPEGARQLHAMLEDTDILVEQFRPGIMEKLGFGYTTVSAAHPRLIYCSISGYGQDGPRAQEAGHDLNYIGNTGLLALQPGPADRPVVPPALVADIGGGTFPAVINILLALRRRDQTGQGCRLDIAMTDAMFAFAWHAFACHSATGKAPAPGASEFVGGSPRYRLYPARDGRIVACAALEDHFWARFCKIIGLAPELADDRRDADATGRAVAALIAARPASEWEPLFAAADCCVTIVRSLDEALADPHFVARGLFGTAREDGSLPPLPVPIAPVFRSGE
jgi:crotonobetainyl-CoA:carnitine CoA-transferase CaiB-like acyl-CoA transferase